MLIIAAIDLLGGRCVRLKQGDYSKEMFFGDDPADIARRWVDEGVKYLHIVDLDGAREGWPVNGDVIAEIVRSAGVPCQMGGGLRDQSGIEEVLDLGIDRVVVGTRAILDPEWFAAIANQFPGKLALGLDTRDGKLATRGWQEATSLTAAEVAGRYGELPLAAIVHTDISKDGMLGGPNFESTTALAEACTHPVIASGGVTTIDDVLELRQRGISACILGRTIYEGTIKLPDLLKRLEESSA